MNKRLLTKEEREAILARCHYLTMLRDKFYFNDGLVMGAEAQDAKTRKEDCKEFWKLLRGCFDRIDPNEITLHIYKIPHWILETLKRGEMPDETLDL